MEEAPTEAGEDGSDQSGFFFVCVIGRNEKSKCPFFSPRESFTPGVCAGVDSQQ